MEILFASSFDRNKEWVEKLIFYIASAILML